VADASGGRVEALATTGFVSFWAGALRLHAAAKNTRPATNGGITEWTRRGCLRTYSSLHQWPGTGSILSESK
jgi:hypothetical protein